VKLIRGAINGMVKKKEEENGSEENGLGEKRKASSVASAWLQRSRRV
jgi:hypothetical protein